jgi:hypothetical protein
MVIRSRDAGQCRVLWQPRASSRTVGREDSSTTSISQCVISHRSTLIAAPFRKAARRVSRNWRRPSPALTRLRRWFGTARLTGRSFQDLVQFNGIYWFQKMTIESSFARALLIVCLSPTSQRNQHHWRAVGV